GSPYWFCSRPNSSFNSLFPPSARKYESCSLPQLPSPSASVRHFIVSTVAPSQSRYRASFAAVRSFPVKFSKKEAIPPPPIAATLALLFVSPLGLLIVALWHHAFCKRS